MMIMTMVTVCYCYNCNGYQKKDVFLNDQDLNCLNKVYIAMSHIFFSKAIRNLILLITYFQAYYQLLINSTILMS